MRKTFEEAQIGNIKFKNRIIRSATHDGLANNNGMPTRELIDLYKEIALGEVGGIITGYTGIQQDGKASLKNMLMIDKDEFIPKYQELTREIHKYKVPIILQIAHCGRQTKSKITGHPVVAPSRIIDKVFNEDTPIELSEKQIYKIIHNFVLAIERAKKSGFDGVQLHLAHGYLL